MLKQFDILLVDDSAIDAMVFSEALKEVSPTVKAYWVSGADEAIAFLKQEGQFREMAPVKLVVLDLHMPRVNGIETLRLIKGIPSLSVLPVVVLSSSRDKRDIDLVYSLGANVFLPKLTLFEQYLEEVRILVHHWLHFAELPSVAFPSARAPG